MLEKFVAGIDRSRMQTNDFLVALNQKLQQHIGYNIRMEPGIQKCEETLALGRGLGSCRDTAWLLVQVLRHLGLAARFVSGYLVQLTADLKSLDELQRDLKDFTDLHAWTEVYLPGAGCRLALIPPPGYLPAKVTNPACLYTQSGKPQQPITGASARKPRLSSIFITKSQRVHEEIQGLLVCRIE